MSLSLGQRLKAQAGVIPEPFRHIAQKQADVEGIVLCAATIWERIGPPCRAAAKTPRSKAADGACSQDSRQAPINVRRRAEGSPRQRHLVLAEERR